MNPVFEDKRKRVINGQEEIKFDSFSSFHLISITARVRSRKQLSSQATDDEDLIVTIDGKSFPKLEDSKRLIDSPAAFSGGRLHNLSKTIYFLLFLKGKSHKIILTTDEPSKTAALENFTISSLDLNNLLKIEPNLQAEDGDRRPWITLVLLDLSLKEFTVSLNLKRRFLDSDDVKVVVDGDTKLNHRSLLHKLWYFIASSITGEVQSQAFLVNLSRSLHYLEFHADRLPALHNLTLDFGERPVPSIGIPTAPAPRWTEDFYDDNETILLARTIYGEVGGEKIEGVKIAVGWAIRNRVEDKLSRWAKNYHGVILEPSQYAPFLDQTEDVFKRIVDPPLSDPDEKQAWLESFEAAEAVISGQIMDPTQGANHFYSTTIPRPEWADEKKLTIFYGITRFYKL